MGCGTCANENAYKSAMITYQASYSTIIGQTRSPLHIWPFGWATTALLIALK